MTLVTTGNHVGDTEALPKWAQRHIADLESEVRNLEAQLRAANGRAYK